MPSLLPLILACVQSGKDITDTATPETGDTSSADTSLPTRACPNRYSGEGIPYAFWGMNGFDNTEGFADVADRFGITSYETSSEAPGFTVGTLLPAVRAAGLSVGLRMSGDYTDNDGNFDLERWKAGVTAWEASGVQEFIDDGTLSRHMILDDIDTFPGSDPDAADLDEMARYSQQILPGLLTFVREDATRMPMPVGGRYVYLEAVDNQYSITKGAVTDYAVEQYAKARELDLCTIYGLNIADGGDGSSGQPGWSEGKFAMSADEIETNGAILLADSSQGALAMIPWEYDGVEEWPDGTVGSDYFDQPDFQQALYDLSQLAAQY